MENKNYQIIKSKIANLKNVKHFVEHIFVYVDGMMDI
jgi:hypothetical protein